MKKYFLLFFVGIHLSWASGGDCKRKAGAFAEAPAFLGLLAQTCKWKIESFPQALEYKKLWAVVLEKEGKGLPWDNKDFISKFTEMMKAELQYNENEANPSLSASLASSLENALEVNKKQKDLSGSAIKFALDFLRSNPSDEGMTVAISGALANTFELKPVEMTKLLIGFMREGNPLCKIPLTDMTISSPTPNYLSEVAELLKEPEESFASSSAQASIVKSIETVAQATTQEICLKDQLKVASQQLLNVLPPEKQNKIHN